MNIAISINTAWNIANFRAGLIGGLRAVGYDVVAMAPPDENVARIEALGCRFVPLEMDNKGTNPVRDVSLFMRYRALLKREKPDAFLGYTIKPNVYGSLAAQGLGIPVINNVSGLGTAFIRDTVLTRIVKRLYRTALAGSECVFFQNDDDRQLFVSSGLISADQTRLLPGSGIDLTKFSPGPALDTASGEPMRFLLIARLVYDKGVREYVEAARMVRETHPDTVFEMLGFLDVENRTAVSRADVDRWTDEGVISYLGSAEDVRPHIARADCVVLPSYREGTPRSLLEAAAMGTPIITTDVPGCREVVDDGVNGFLCEVRNAGDLARKMTAFCDLSAEDRARMGAAGRAKMESEFDEKIVIEHYLDAIERALHKRKVMA